MYDLPIEEDSDEKIVPHVCTIPHASYVIRVRNGSQRHIACAVTVDGENALLKDGSLIVSPGDCRELPGYLVSKNFVGKEYVKEYRSFVFGRPKVVEASTAAAEEVPYTTYGCIKCDVFEAVLDEEVDSDQELRGQTTFYRGAGLHGTFDERVIPEGKKKHFLYSAVTVQGPRSSIANSTRGRWWVRGTEQMCSLQVRYREAHSLMLLGVDPRALGVASGMEEQGTGVKAECKDEAKKEEEDSADEKEKIICISGTNTGLMEVCDLTSDDAPSAWKSEAPCHAEPVGIDR